MNISTIKLTIAIVSLISFSVPSAQAQGAYKEGNARFKFSANVWPKEASKVPGSQYAPAAPAHKVVNGAVPKSANFLGLSPEMLKKPEPQVQTTVAAVPSYTQAVPQVVLPKTEFKHQFGQSKAVEAPKVATAEAAKPASKVSHKPVHIASNKASKRVAGKVLTGAKTQPAEAVASYGNGFGYKKGIFVPGAGGSDGLNATTRVTGRVINQ